MQRGVCFTVHDLRSPGLPGPASLRRKSRGARVFRLAAHGECQNRPRARNIARLKGKHCGQQNEG